MSVDDYEKIDATLLALSAACERAERTARSLRESDAPAHVVDALEEVDRTILKLHRRLTDAAYFEGRGERKTEEQLSLSA